MKLLPFKRPALPAVPVPEEEPGSAEHAVVMGFVEEMLRLARQSGWEATLESLANMGLLSGGMMLKGAHPRILRAMSGSGSALERLTQVIDQGLRMALRPYTAEELDAVRAQARQEGRLSPEQIEEGVARLAAARMETLAAVRTRAMALAAQIGQMESEGAWSCLKA